MTSKPNFPTTSVNQGFRDTVNTNHSHEIPGTQFLQSSAAGHGSRLSLLVQWLDALFADHLACVRRNVQALVSVPGARSAHFYFLLGIPKHGLLLTIGLHTQPDP